MSTWPSERANDARETSGNRWKESPWTVRRAPGWGGRREQRWRLAREAMRRDAERRKFPEEHLRPRPWPLLQVHASNGPGAAATAGRWRRRGAIVRRAAATAVRFRPRGGSGSDGGGKRTPCVCECRGSCTGCQPTFPDGKWHLATLGNLYLQPAMRRRAVLCHCSSAPWPSAAGPLWGHRPVEAVSALHHLFSPRLFRYSAPRPHTLVVEFESPPQDPDRGLPG